MRSKMTIIHMFAAVIIIVGVYGVTGVMASGPPLTCNDGTYYANPYIPEDGAPFPRPYDNAIDPSQCAGGYVWEYIITSPDPKAMSAITKIHVYIPSTPPNTIELLDPIGVERGDGAQSTGKMYGNGIYNGVVASVTPLSGVSVGKLISFCTDVNSYGTVSIGFETSRTLTGCEAAETDSQGPIGGIIGPGFLPSPQAVWETTKILQMGSDPTATVCAKKHPQTGCVKYYFKCDAPNQAPLPTMSGPPAGFGNIIDMGDLEDPLCREAVFGTQNSPKTYYGKAGADYYCLGIYDAALSPTWYQPCDTYPY